MEPEAGVPGLKTVARWSEVLGMVATVSSFGSVIFGNLTR
jgi:hypothetical protein